ncbi:MAG TPA: four-carbon acid sugar kinase family protein, partial [bacterium]|nr:four-carbon acid sugar kinase family protein [bacterium]
MTQLLILADDLTGCSDCASLFTDYAPGVSILPFFPGRAHLKRKNGVLIINTESRHLKPQEAFRRNLCLLQKVKAGRIYKKFDSTLRGNLLSETRALLHFMTASRQLSAANFYLPLCFSFPEQKRITVKGIQYAGGIPIKDTVFGSDPKLPV